MCQQNSLASEEKKKPSFEKEVVAMEKALDKFIEDGDYSTFAKAFLPDAPEVPKFSGKHEIPMEEEKKQGKKKDATAEAA